MIEIPKYFTGDLSDLVRRPPVNVEITNQMPSQHIRQWIDSRYTIGYPPFGVEKKDCFGFPLLAASGGHGDIDFGPNEFLEIAYEECNTAFRERFKGGLMLLLDERIENPQITTQEHKNSFGSYMHYGLRLIGTLKLDEFLTFVKKLITSKFDFNYQVNDPYWGHNADDKSGNLYVEAVGELSGFKTGLLFEYWKDLAKDSRVLLWATLSKDLTLEQSLQMFTENFDRFEKDWQRGYYFSSITAKTDDSGRAILDREKFEALRRLIEQTTEGTRREELLTILKQAE